MVKKSLALRRHHRFRVRRNAGKKLRSNRWLSDQTIRRLTLRLAENMRACSCSKCSFSYPHHKQKVADFDSKEQIDESFEDPDCEYVEDDQPHVEDDDPTSEWFD